MFSDVLLWVIFIGIASIICLPLNSFIFNTEMSNKKNHKEYWVRKN